MSKKLKVTFSGVCTFAPRIPKEGAIGEFFVLMPAARSPRLARQHDKNGNRRIVARHHAYIYVPDKFLNAVPEPAMLVRDEKLGLCNIYLMDFASISFDQKPTNALEYFHTNLPVKGRPNADDPTIAPPNDSRWVPDVAEVFPSPAKLKPEVDPRKDITNGQVTMVVHVTGGLIESSHPCNTAQTRTFKPEQVHIDARVMTSELTVTMEFADETKSIKVMAKPLDPGELLSGLDDSGLELFWRDKDIIQLRIGNDTLDEIVAIRNSSRCEPVPDLPETDTDFDLHYDLLNVALTPDLPLPTRGGDEGDMGGCVGLTVDMPDGGE